MIYFRNISKLLILTIILCFSYTQALADPSGEDLYKICNPPPNEDPIINKAMENLCIYYIAGFRDGLYTEKTISELHTKSCLPQKMFSVQQAVLIVKKYMDNHQERLGKLAGSITMEAIYTAFPCKK